MNKLARIPELVRLVLILTTCFFACETALLRSIDPEIQQSIDDFITKVYLPASKISKLGLAIVKNNSEVVYSTGYGMANEDKEIANGNQTQFLIGSVTKTFTASVVVKLLHELFPKMGEAVLDTPVMKLMPLPINFTLEDRYRTEHFTFRDLLSHRMCIARDDLILTGEPFTETSEIVYRQRYAAGTCGMRSEYKYNNEMYVIAGELAGILANKSYNQLVNELLWEIGMYNSSLASKSDDFSDMPFRAQPYYMHNGTSFPMNPDLVKRVVVVNAAAGLFVPPNDMITYMKFLLNKGSVNGKQIIPKDVMSWMTKPSIIVPKMQYRSSDEGPYVAWFGYGLGMGLATYDGWEYNSHAGYISPYRSMLSLFPSQTLGIFTSTSETLPYVDDQVIHQFIFEILRGTSGKHAIEKLKKLWENADTVKTDEKRIRAEALEKFVKKHAAEPVQKPEELIGKYGSGDKGNAEVLFQLNPGTNKTGLYLQYGKWWRGWMENVSGSIYKILWDTDIIQDDYSDGDLKGFVYIGVANGTLQFFYHHLDKFVPLGTLTLGVSLENLPVIPWEANSC